MFTIGGSVRIILENGALDPGLHDIQYVIPRFHFVLFFGVTNNTAQSAGGNFKNSKPIGEVGCCESQITKRSH